MVPGRPDSIANTSFVSSESSIKSHKVPENTHIVLLEMLLEIPLVLLDKKCVVGLLKCPSPTHKFAL